MEYQDTQVHPSPLHAATPSPPSATTHVEQDYAENEYRDSERQDSPIEATETSRPLQLLLFHVPNVFITYAGKGLREPPKEEGGKSKDEWDIQGGDHQHYPNDLQ